MLTRIGAALAVAALLVAATPASATSVAYVDGGQLWVASTDGTQKRALSGPSDNAQTWRYLAQSDDGHVLGVRSEAGKMGNFNSTRLWAPDGTVAGDGALTVKPGRTTYALPVGLDLSPDGKLVVYGYSNSSGIGLGQTFEFGTYAAGSSGWYTEPLAIDGREWPSLLGRRLVTTDGSIVSLQDAPDGPDHTPWIDVAGTGMDPTRADVAATGTVMAVELVNRTGPITEGKIAMLPVDGPGGALKGGDCYLPTQGRAGDVSLSQDTKQVAWHDDRGVVVAGIPDFSGADPCTLTAPPVVISATGTMPSIGAAPASLAGPGPTPGGGGGAAGPAPGGGAPVPAAPSPKPPGGAPATTAPKAAVPSRIGARSLRAGVTVPVTVGGPGAVTVVGRVGRTVVARGRATAKAAGRTPVRLKATQKARSRLARLKGRTMVLTITAPGGTLTVKRKLR